MDVVTDYMYNGAYMKGGTSSGPSGDYPTPISQYTMNNNDCIGYLYYVWIMTSNEGSQTQWNQISTMGLMNVSSNPNFFIVNNLPVANYPQNHQGVTPQDNPMITCIPWWFALQHFGQSAYVDLITLPVPVEFAL